MAEDLKRVGADIEVVANAAEHLVRAMEAIPLVLDKIPGSMYDHYGLEEAFRISSAGKPDYSARCVVAFEAPKDDRRHYKVDIEAIVDKLNHKSNKSARKGGLSYEVGERKERTAGQTCKYIKVSGPQL
jgi:hypothetical protein